MKSRTRCGVVMLVICMACHSIVRAQLPQLKINDKEDPNVFLSKLSIDVKVAGTIATTTMEMTFTNKNSRILEGELLFPMPEGISVSRYALDINGRMREAVPVEKERATQVFEEIERQRVDPGLLERVEGNNFRTRIYPIPAHGSRTILIAYEEELMVTGKQQLRYHLPMDYKRPIDLFKLDISVVQQALKPDIEEEPGDDLQFKAWNNNYNASLKKEHFLPEHSLSFTIPQPADHLGVMMQESGGNYYFLVNCFPKQDKRDKPKVDEATVIWDASLSGLNRETKKELDLLDKYIDYNKNLTIHLTTINNGFRKVGSYRITNGDWSTLRKAIEQLTYDGGTNFSRISYPASDEYLLFSDGMSSLSIQDIPLPNKPVYAISSSPKSDFSQLQYIAQKTGGAFINLGVLKPGEAAPLLTQQSLQFLGIKPNRAISETYPSLPKPIVHQFSLAGMTTEPTATITLLFGYGKTVTSEKTIALNFQQQATDLVNLGRVWAQKKIGDLDVQYEQHKDMITFLGKQFSIVTRNTSLIVLETVNDYVRYEIEPPAELRDQYDRIMKQQIARRESQQQLTLANALQQLNTLVTWWKRSFVAQVTPKPIKPAEAESRPTPPAPQPITTQDNAIRRKENRVVAQRNSVGVEREAAPARESLEEVVVVGYGIAKKSAMLGSVSAQTVPANNNQDLPTALAGRVPGVQVADNKTRALRNDDAIERNLAKDDKVINEPDGTKRILTSIDIKQWTPDRAYLQAIAKEKAANRYAAYLTLRKEYLYTPTFYYDMANFFFRSEDTLTGLQILTNMAEIDLENHELYKLLGYKLREAGAYEEAVAVFKKVLQWRPMEPHSYRDYGLALADAGLYQQAVDTLYTALQKNYSESSNGMYMGIEEIIVTEINQLISLHKSKLNLTRIDPKLIHNMPTDIRVVLNWNKNDTDMDLWVTDPNQETCYYSHKETLIGGRISKDFTRGYGPEQFLLKKAANGKYLVKVNYYGDQQFKFSGPTTVMAEIYTHYADGRQERKLITLQMEKGSRQEGILVGEFQFGSSGGKQADDRQAARNK
ncbi:VIT domain-containing protein [Paraflavitalea sp. CAU 1676]|uniref:VIT domain-containing protein n=1 Tax=Paraflavitalea sp. CAU 1676 TaxID=3032598 RepID=UPI0023DBB833|nr:VIT domain-containing protein [Paraflavitalea sp. CAU 1676]MDF2187495.1 VIT domain-containing protein [Paraflavitalea sp. CAU 1676]